MPDGGMEEKLQKVENIGAADQVLRHRGHKAAVGATKPTAEDGEKPKWPSADDPLRWFGVLVPQSLRGAQRNFRQGASVASDRDRSALTSSHNLVSLPQGSFWLQKSPLYRAALKRPASNIKLCLPTRNGNKFTTAVNILYTKI
ncbi:hypothetical protein GDO78_021035 [Eleutherodactylus coqui]|nr:hypothetical protein GDO78_021035 [Eleutherodactylus coqui]